MSNTTRDEEDLMEMPQHYRTWQSFVTLIKFSFIGVTAILVLLAWLTL